MLGMVGDGKVNMGNGMLPATENNSTCCLLLMFALPLPPVVLVLQPPQSGTHSHLAIATLPLPIPFVAFLKPTASSRSSAPPSDSPKCLRFGHWLTLCTLNIHLLTYLLSLAISTWLGWVPAKVAKTTRTWTKLISYEIE